MSDFKLGPRQEAWLRDLENEGHRQGKSFLRTKGMNIDSFCCLGRACEVSIFLGLDLIVDESYPQYVAYGFTRRSQVLPEEVQEFFRFRSPSGEPLVGAIYRDPLAYCNDDGMSFAEIAAMVRENPEMYFEGPA